METHMKIYSCIYVYGTLALLYGLQLRALFNSWDSDGNGTLSLGELKEAMESMGHDDSDIRKMFLTADENGDGSIDFEEFTVLMKV